MKFRFFFALLGLLVLAGCATPIETVAGRASTLTEQERQRRLNDADQDGIVNQLDRCPDTAPGVPVDVYGCPPDRDGDGVFDHLDLCPETPPGMAVDTDGCPEQVLLEKVVAPAPEPVPEPEPEPLASQVLLITFHTGSARLTEDFRDEFSRGADFIRSYPGSRVTIEGHTDSVGPATWNLKLSLQRAEAARRELLRQLGEDFPIELVGYGETRQEAGNDTPQGRQQNRRVVIRIDPPDRP